MLIDYTQYIRELILIGLFILIFYLKKMKCAFVFIMKVTDLLFIFIFIETYYYKLITFFRLQQKKVF